MGIVASTDDGVVPMHLVVLGPPASGKGAVCEALIKDFAGELFGTNQTADHK